MKQKILLLVFILTILICISSILSLNCTKERYSFNSGVEIRSYVNNHPKMVNKIKIPDDYSPCPIKSISSSTCSGSARYSDTITAEKICELNATNSYYKVISKTSSYYNSCSDNTIWYWDVNKNDGVVAPACNFNSILDTLTCEREVCKTQCSDGIDNDNDEKIDWPNDEGCLNADDDNEYGEPIGYLDAVRNCNDVFGWVCDPDDFNSVVDVHLYKDGPVGAGGSLLAIVKANVKRESAVGNLCGGNSTHGFSFPLPANLKNGTQQKIYAYGINLGTPANNVKLSGSPLSFTCAPECTEKDTIFKVLNSEKSKAAVYNDINFFNQICYNKIFPPANPPFTAPQTCSANNKNLVLWLKSNSDSTVSTTQSTEFNIPVCYGDLKCRTIDTRQSQSCNPEDEMLVVSLSDTTNALVSKGNYIDYPIKICCKSQASLNSAFWANMKDESITSADLKDRVRLIAPGKNLKNEQIQFKIYKKETLGGIDFLARDKFITSVHTDKAFDEWIAGKKSDTEFSGGIYYFIATIGGDTSTEKRSGDLIVSDTESNDPPFVNITSPENCNIFFTGNEIEFKQNSYDVDDNFNYEWDFGDGTKLSGNSVNRENYNPKHIYSGDNLGKKTIKLTVRDDRSKSSTDSVSILILNNVQETKTYSCASIKLPENGKTYGREVTHDAEGTYKIKVEPKLSGDLCNKTITCEAGLCPEKVKMNPTCYPSTSALISIISAPTSSSPANYGNIEFCWNHKDFSGNYSANDNCVSGDNGGKSIRKLFTSTGTKNSRLNIKTDISSYEEVSFIVAFDKYTCQVISEDTTSLPKGSYWISQDSTINSFNDCRRLDSLIQGATCCPNGYQCSNDNKCVLTSIKGCSDFKTQTECTANNGNKEIAEKGAKCNGLQDGKKYGTNDKCVQFCKSKCVWDNICKTSSESGVLYEGNPNQIFEYNKISEANSLCLPSSSNKKDITYQCVFQVIKEGDCDSGGDLYRETVNIDYLKVQDGAQSPINYPTGDPDIDDYIKNELRCGQSGTRIITCQNQVRLPFFDYRNFLVSVLILIVIYYFMLRKNNKYSCVRLS